MKKIIDKLKNKKITRDQLLNYYEKNIKERKYLYITISVLVLILLGVLLYWGINSLVQYRNEKKLVQVNEILNSDVLSIDNCRFIMDFDKTKISPDNTFFREQLFDSFSLKCVNKFDISKIEINEENCELLIRESKSYFKERYLILDSYKNKINECSSKYLKIQFSTGSFFDVENDFKSNINIDFSLDFYTDIEENGNEEEFLNNRIEAKNRLLGLIEIEPEIDITVDDVILYPKRAIFQLTLLPLNEYKISLKSFETNIGEDSEKQEFVFQTPENKYFGMKSLNEVSLFQTNNPPKFEILEYNTEKQKTKVKLCRISLETYTKLEAYRKNGDDYGNIDDVKEYFKTGINDLETIECKEKEIVFKSENEGEDSNNKIELIKKEFNFDDLLGNISKTGFYFAYFSNIEDREYNGRLNYPIFFGVINSHIIMKTSRNGESFFFVNDFSGKPLANQNIYVYSNNFVSKEQKYNRETRNYDITYYGVPEKGIFDEKILLGKTGDDGILKVNLEEKLEDVFYRTFSDNWEYDFQGLYKNFFIEASGDNNLSYLSSTWNGGIAPWNFGYKLNDYYWYTNDSKSQDDILLSRRGVKEPEFYSHLYTDRVLYLPGEEVNIKGIIRNSSDLSIPVNKQANLKVLNSKGEEVLSKLLDINEFGSVNDTLTLSENDPLGSYNISLSVDDENIAYSGFSVEVFKNPKFKNEILLETEGLNNSFVEVKKEEKTDYKYYSRTEYKSDFKIKAKVFSKYYNGASLKNASFEYKIYRQYYRENAYWDNCYYGCYREPNKEFYSEGKGKINENGVGEFEVAIDFSSYYNDYKYIVEVTITDTAGDTISSSNSIIAKLPNEYKRYNSSLSLHFESKTKFVRQGLDTLINGGLNIGNWGEYYNDKYVFVIKKKEYYTTEVNDVNGFTRPVTKTKENLEQVLLINDKNFNVTEDGKLELKYKLKETGEYVFEYGKIDTAGIIDYTGTGTIEQIKELITEFNDTKTTNLSKLVYENKEIETCEKNDKQENINCNTEIKNIEVEKKLEIDSLLDDKQYFTVLSYGYELAKNPVLDDNKIRVIPEKISYNVGEKAKVLIRLPVENAKILWTIEKAGVVKSEYIDVKGNIFFKEFTIDDTFVPNAYIGVVMVDTRKDVIPEYKVGYSEIVVDKTDKKSFITIQTDKETYKPREKVTLNLGVKDKNNKAIRSELTVMVVDDSLISLMGNVDLNSLEKFYKKLDFQTQTSITNIAMLKNYYFSRPGIVGGSGFGNFKGGDSAVSTRNIFKNTAYYNSSVITDWDGNAQISFELPDNLTNFRIMVLSNSKDNFFGYSEKFIETRQNVIVEDKTPMILREGDKTSIGANIFNNTDKEIGFKVELKAGDIEVTDPIKEIKIPASSFEFVSWDIFNDYNKDEIQYTISALGDIAENSDKIENTIDIKASPVLFNSIIKSGTVSANNVLDLDVDIPENTNIEKSKIELVFSNNKLNGIDKILSSLAKYPYGCIEQTTSSTLPNAILKKFDKIFSAVSEGTNIEKNLTAGINRIKGMQTSDGGFAYWPGGTSSNLHITPYVVRSLVEMKESGVELPEGLLENAVKYLENNLEEVENDDEKAEILWALATAGKKTDIKLDSLKLGRHSLIAYTYSLILNKEENSFLLEQNIEKIKTFLKNDNSSYLRYRNNLSDKAIFTSMLLDYNYDKNYVNELIGKLYSYDWNSYYYSTQSKNNAFLAFAKYLEKQLNDNKSKFGFMLGTERNHDELFWIGKVAPNFRKYEYPLNDVLFGDKLEFRAANIEGADIYVTLTVNFYPEDKTKIKSYNNEMTIERKIYEVLDENKLQECSNNNYYNKNKQTCDTVLKNTNGNIFKLGELYKAEIIVKLDDNKTVSDLVVEDYLPGSFKVINSKFKTEQSIVTGATKNRRWNHVEFNPDVVMANSSYVHRGTANYEYYFRPEFSGTFTMPPATSYLMYNPSVRANTEFNIITVE